MGSPVEGWNWTAIAAVGTWAAAVVALVIALFGEWLRARLNPPKLERSAFRLRHILRF
jgi:hypothetical protein